MGTITTLRPSATSSGSGWTPSAGTLHGVTSDDNDATYATWGGAGSELVLATPADAPPAGERRHQVRLRARGEDGDAWWAVRLNSGVLVAGASAQFTSSPSTVTGSWGFGAPPDGSTVLFTNVTGQSTGLKINELYLDVDSREAPTFTPQILDGSGASSVLIADTAQPIVRANDIDLDDLNAREYRYWVTLNGAIVWDTGVVSGAAVNRQTAALDNGDYVAHLMVWSRLGQNTAYASDEETISFTVQVGQVTAPDNPTVTVEPDSPFYRIEGCIPYVGDMDNGQGWLEIQRVDCPVGGYLSLPGTVGSYASTPDLGLPAPAELEVIVKAWRGDDWRPADDDVLVSHYDTGGDQRGWRVYLDSDGDGDQAMVGRPSIGWSPDGVAEPFSRATRRAPIDPYGVVRLKINLVPDDGLGNNVTTYYTRETDDAEWELLGDPVTQAFGSAIHPSTAPYAVGSSFVAGLSFNRFEGRIFSAEVYDDGVMILNPDFTDHLDGTREFTDTLGNDWTVNGSAAIYSPTSVYTVAMLGPLASDECAEWVDFTLPRSGMGATCDHAPVSCCSYYRARTVGRMDGDLRISNWSDVFDPAVPNGVIMMWPSTAASLPDGWDRVTALDGVYPKSVPDAVTDPGATGGAATHTHSVPTHVHDTSHVHTMTGATGAATGTASSTTGAAGTTAALSSHTHTRSSLNSATVNSGTATPAIGTVNNDPARLEVIFAESNGTPLGIPDGALALAPDVSLSGWTDYASGADRFFKGAAAAGNGGTTAASALDGHLHTIAAHTHTGTSHGHTSPNTGSFSSDRTLSAGAQSVLWTTSHSHPVSVGSSTSAALASGGSGNSGTSAGNDPPYRNLRVKENTSGDVSLPMGLICAWRGSLGAIPRNWELCDGTAGRPDLLGRYPRGATTSIEGSGGSLAAHNHTSPSHSHTTSTHNHTTTVTSAGTAVSNVSSTVTVTVVTGTHTHSSTNADNATPTVGNSTSGTLADATCEPVHEEVAFIQLVTEPAPPPDPDTFCLNWSDDEHLIRTLGLDGPLWVPVLGKFEWSVDRPFTASTGVNGTRFVASAPPGGRDLSLTCAVESEAALAELQEVLARPLVLISPSDATEVWAAPVAGSVKIVKVDRIRQVTASFIGTGPQPEPQLSDVGV